MKFTLAEFIIAGERLKYNTGQNKSKNNCWPILGISTNKTQGAYATITVNNKTVPAHRFSYMYHKGKIPKGYVVRHKCDNPRCVNPDHLEIGTQRDNALDHVEREPNKSIKLNTECVKVIKWFLQENDKKDWPNSQLAKKLANFHRVRTDTIYGIKSGLTWKQVTI